MGNVRGWVISKSWMVLALVVLIFGTALSPFVMADQRNILVILLSVLALPLILFFKFSVGRDFWWGMAVIFNLLFVDVYYGANNLSSVIYTAIFIMAYVASASALESGYIRKDKVCKLLHYLLLAFFFVSVVQLLFSFLGLTIPNNILNKGMWSYNSLFVEPAQASKVVVLTYFCYLLLSVGVKNKISLYFIFVENKFVTLPVFVIMLLTGSATAIAGLFLMFVFSFGYRSFLIAVVFLALCWPILMMVDVERISRLVLLLSAIPSMDVASVTAADHSGAIRILPIIIFISQADISDTMFWFGGGYESIGLLLRGTLLGVDKDVVMAGFVPAYMIVTGVLGFALFFWAFIARFLNASTFSYFMLWIPLMIVTAWNTQLFWYSVVLFRILYYFSIESRGSGLGLEVRV